jgi:O-antigen/teichoic acid export membrane protein
MATSGIKDTSYLVISKVTVIFLALGTQSCLAWLLGPAGRGSYAVCALFAMFLTAILILGCEMATQYSLITKRFNVSEAIVYAFIYGFIGCLVAIPIGVLILKLPISYLEKATTDQFYLALVSIPASLFSLTFIRMLAGLREFKWFCIAEITHASLLLVLTLFFVWGMKMGVTGALLALVLSGFLIVGIIIGFLQKKYGLERIKFSFRKLGQMFSYGFRYHPGRVSNTLNVHVGAFILAWMASSSDVGLFSVASALMLKVELVPNALLQVLLPRIAEDKEGRKDLVIKCMRVVLVLSAVMLLGLGAVCSPVIPILFSPKFRPIIVLIWLLIPGVFLRSVSKVFIPYMLGTNRPGYLSMSVMAGMVANVVSLYLLLPLIKLPAASVAMTINYAVSSTLLFFFFRKFSGFRFAEMFDFKREDWAMLIQFIKTKISKIRQLELAEK